jgi:hypothetical protein
MRIFQKHDAFGRNEPDAFKASYQTFERSVNEPISIGVLDAEYESALMLLCEEVVIERGPETTDMKIPCRRRRESDTNGSGHRSDNSKQ